MKSLNNHVDTKIDKQAERIQLFLFAVKFAIDRSLLTADAQKERRLFDVPVKLQARPEYVLESQLIIAFHF